MADYRFSLLCSLINKKLGLEKKVSKPDTLVNEIIHEIKKTIPKDKLHNTSFADSSLNNHCKYNHIQGRILKQYVDDRNKHFKFT